MKTLKTNFKQMITLSTVILSLFFISCSSDDDGDKNPVGNGNNDTYKNEMTATISGAVNLDFKMLGIFIASNSDFSTKLSLQASEVNPYSGVIYTLYIGFKNGVRNTTKYTISDNSDVKAYFLLDTLRTPAPYDLGFEKNTSGEINITKITDEVIQGTFHFTATDYQSDAQISVTNGNFTYVKKD